MEKHLDKILVEGLYTNWISSLIAYSEELRHLRLTVQQLVHQYTFDDSIDLQNLDRDISINLQFIDGITQEVNRLRFTYNNSDEGKQGTMTEMFARNRVREKIRKLEQSCFMVKYRVNKYMLKVS